MVLPRRDVSVREDEEAVVPADGAIEAHAELTDPRPNLRVVESRMEIEAQIRPTAHPFHDAQQLPVGLTRPTPPHREAIEQSRLSAAAAERGLQDQRPLEVAPG